ncbi:MAG: SAM-dependent methyltransferase [Bacteroidetes bacterium]|nr:MAG: SAM-dependent methyltransferase [Bacteroidota bacterium]
MFHNRLSKVLRHLQKQAKRQGITCYRIYDKDIPEFPLSIDLYEGKIYVSEYQRNHGLSDEEHEAWLDASVQELEKLFETPRENIFVKSRQRKAGRLGQYQKTDDAGDFFIVHENGLKFRVNLSDYLDTGLFLDHRITREMVRAESKDKTVLNLFAYTGAFSVYAASGKARKVVTVDLSNTYLNWAKANMAINGFTDKQKYEYEAADVKQYLKVLKPDIFDLVVMDPPTFSNSKKMGDDFLDIKRDHVSLINETLRAMKKGGVLYFSTNFTKFQMEVDAIRTTTIKDITRQTIPFDFAGKLKRYCWKITK